ncbi:BRO-N domain-containing protein [Laribacter hongkongensis]|uniref:BRO-N domain-containing protein n=1 Tax=Laribacter hongkongensis TaxID=168471 RepID=UPI001EFE0747|nr:Bro-N domain-containing protein [Laribacter hongkongensis]MCG9078970.1 Bro-N domain-containing protein [Laribacter hongkongensis]
MHDTAQGAPAPAIFNFNDHTVRILDKDGELWFVASDVAAALEYRDAANMVRNLDGDEADTHILSTRSENGIEQDREVTIISESGLYSAILRSRKPEARRFKKWVTSEVLPAIRKTGQYRVATEHITHEQYLALRRRVYNIAEDLWFESACQNAIWKLLREASGTASCQKMPMDELEHAHAVLTWIEERKRQIWPAYCTFHRDVGRFIVGQIQQLDVPELRPSRLSLIP